MNIGFIFGGRSVEHEVSIIHAIQAINALPAKYQAIPIYISKEGQWYSGDCLKELSSYQNISALLNQAIKVDFAVNYQNWQLTEIGKGGLFAKPKQIALDLIIPVIHGAHGEDGCLQGLLELSGIPYAGPNVLGAALGMDKIAMKAILKEAALPVVDYMAFSRQAWQNKRQDLIDQAENLGYPLIVKPATLGSSIGINKVANQEELIIAIDLAADLALRILVEKAVCPLRELNCAIIGSGDDYQLSAIEEPLSSEQILSFADKYLGSGAKEGSKASGMTGAKRQIPAQISDDIAAQVYDLTAKAFAAMDGLGVCRIDFLLNSDTGKLYINELNTIPGSLSFYLFAPTGLDYPALLEKLISLALDQYRIKQKTVYTYQSNILAGGHAKGKK